MMIIAVAGTTLYPDTPVKITFSDGDRVANPHIGPGADGVVRYSRAMLGDFYRQHETCAVMLYGDA